LKSSRDLDVADGFTKHSDLIAWGLEEFARAAFEKPIVYSSGAPFFWGSNLLGREPPDLVGGSFSWEYG